MTSKTTKLGTNTNDNGKVMLFEKDIVMRCSIMLGLADHKLLMDLEKMCV